MAKESSAFVRKLAHNDPTIRKSAFKALTKYLQSPLGQKLRLLDLEKLWKGLYFCMWYCDKPVPQQSLAGDLGELFSKVVPQNKLTDFHRAFWVVLLREWYSIDKWRVDKFMMLVRRVIRHQFFRLSENGWDSEEVAAFVDVLGEYPLANNPKFPQSLAYHVCDLYLDEIEYVVFKDFRDYSEESMGEESSDESDDSESEDESDSETKEEKKESSSKPSLSEDEIDAKKKEIIAQTPVSALLTPFKNLAESATNKAMRTKCKEEILDDDRLTQWAVTEREESEDEDEWTGF